MNYRITEETPIADVIAIMGDAATEAEAEVLRYHVVAREIDTRTLNSAQWAALLGYATGFVNGVRFHRAKVAA